MSVFTIHQPRWRDKVVLLKKSKADAAESDCIVQFDESKEYAGRTFRVPKHIVVDSRVSIIRSKKGNEVEMYALPLDIMEAYEV